MYGVLERAVVVVLSILAYATIEITMTGSESNPIGIVGVLFLIILILWPAITLRRES